MSPLHWLADLVAGVRLPLDENRTSISHVKAHRRGFTRGWTACLLSLAICYVLYVAGLVILNTPLPPTP